tara:strand:+ start:14917 stop:15873 length:957 start_codon:yes stop_codon:yes gene_type:complete
MIISKPVNLTNIIYFLKKSITDIENNNLNLTIFRTNVDIRDKLIFFDGEKQKLYKLLDPIPESIWNIMLLLTDLCADYNYITNYVIYELIYELVESIGYYTQSYEYRIAMTDLSNTSIFRITNGSLNYADDYHNYHFTNMPITMRERLEYAIYNVFVVNRNIITKLLVDIRFKVGEYCGRHRVITRKKDLIFGSFSESLSPIMIQHIYRWIKKCKPELYKNISHGSKEHILSELNKNNIKVDAKFMCEFIDNYNPTLYCKEWGVSLYEKGKRLTNIEICELLKKSIYEREKNYLRTAHIKPFIRNLPKPVENHICSYL